MKFKLRKTFQIQVNSTKVKVYHPMTYDVPAQMSQYHAERAASMGHGAFVVEPKVEKVAPENKVVDVPENKATVAKPAKRRGRPRTKPDA